MASEQWKDIPGYVGLYRVSDRGRVWSSRRNGLLKIIKNKANTYSVVGLCVDGKVTKVYVHFLVLLAFVGPRPPGYVSRHFPDRDRTNNRLTNLSWGTYTDNQLDRAAHGTDHRGVKHKFAKLDDAKVRRIKSADFSVRGAVRGLAREFNVSLTAIYDARKGKRWGHVA